MNKLSLDDLPWVAQRRLGSYLQARDCVRLKLTCRSLQHVPLPRVLCADERQWAIEREAWPMLRRFYSSASRWATVTSAAHLLECWMLAARARDLPAMRHLMDTQRLALTMPDLVMELGHTNDRFVRTIAGKAYGIVTDLVAAEAARSCSLASWPTNVSAATLLRDLLASDLHWFLFWLADSGRTRPLVVLVHSVVQSSSSSLDWSCPSNPRIGAALAAVAGPTAHLASLVTDHAADLRGCGPTLVHAAIVADSAARVTLLLSSPVLDRWRADAGIYSNYLAAAMALNAHRALAALLPHKPVGGAADVNVDRAVAVLAGDVDTVCALPPLAIAPARPRAPLLARAIVTAWCRVHRVPPTPDATGSLVATVAAPTMMSDPDAALAAAAVGAAIASLAGDPAVRADVVMAAVDAGAVSLARHVVARWPGDDASAPPPPPSLAPSPLSIGPSSPASASNGTSGDPGDEAREYWHRVASTAVRRGSLDAVRWVSTLDTPTAAAEIDWLAVVASVARNNSSSGGGNDAMAARMAAIVQWLLASGRMDASPRGSARADEWEVVRTWMMVSCGSGVAIGRAAKWGPAAATSPSLPAGVRVANRRP
ncbi:hypothetical protein BC828DRAFT_380569 [Blastocladiella britannica]|nr:hypothetical protein BC828DRAFT_380569 [Blastocladiella britannica]